MHRSAPILVIEDDARIAGRISTLLRAADLDIDGPYATVSDAAAALARHFPDVAIVDLHGEDAGLLIDDLENYDIPFLLCPHDASIKAGGRSLVIEEEDLASPILPRLLNLLRDGKKREPALH